VKTEFLERLDEGKFRRAKDAQAWIRKVNGRAGTAGASR